MKELKSSMAIARHTLGLSILIKGVAHMFWNLSSVHFFKNHNPETKLMKWPDDSAWPKGKLNSKLSKSNIFKSCYLRALCPCLTGDIGFLNEYTWGPTLIYSFKNYQVLTSFFLHIDGAFLYLLIFLYSYGLPAWHLFVMFWSNCK